MNVSDMPENEVRREKRKLRDLLCQCRQRFLMKYPFTGAVMMHLDLVPVRDVRLRTASTDGRKIYFDLAFADDLAEEELMFVMAHELWHCILLHMFRGKNFDQQKFNYVADMEVNRLLKEEGFPVPRFALLPDPSWGRISAEEMYEKAPFKRQRRDAAERAEKKPGIEGRFDKHIRAGCDEDDSGKERHVRVFDKWGEVGFDPDYVPLVVSGAADGLRQAVISASQQIERLRGTLPAHLAGVVGRLLKPKFNWKEVLANFVTSCFGGSRRWLPPNRRYVGQGLYLQSSRHERLRAVVAVDTSGSTVGDLRRFFGELEGLLSSFGDYEVTVVQCDAEVQHVETYGADRRFDASSVACFGGGGTSFEPVFKYVDEHPEIAPSLLVYLTDGYGVVRERAPDYPVLWVLTSDGRVPAKWGMVARFRGKDG